MARTRRYLTCGELAQCFGVSPRAAGDWVDSGLFPGSWKMPTNGDRRIPLESVEAFARDRGIAYHLPDTFPGISGLTVVGTCDAQIGDFFGLAGGRVEKSLGGLLWHSAAIRPAVLILDRMLFGQGEVREIVRLISERSPMTRVVVLGLEEEPDNSKEFEPATVLNRPFTFADLGLLIQRGG